MISSAIWALVVLILAREMRQELHRRRQHRSDEAQRVRMDLRRDANDRAHEIDAVRAEFDHKLDAVKAEVRDLREVVSPYAVSKAFGNRPA